MYREIFPQWNLPPRLPDAHEGYIDIWRINLASTTGESHRSAAGPGTGTPDNPLRIQAHNAMHRILGQYLGCPTGMLQIKVQPGGKPRLEAPAKPLEFNLSHSRDIALLAVTAGATTVGIDVETYRKIDDPLRLARRVMPNADCAELASLPERGRLERFLMLWTRMEARQKAVGLGIFAQPVDPALMSNFSFRPGPQQWASLSVSPALTDCELRFFDFSPL